MTHLIKYFLQTRSLGALVPAGLICTLLLVAGCKSVPDSSPSDSAFDWVGGLSEKVDPVPAKKPVAGAPIAAASDASYMSVAWPWGSPRNLTEPIGGSTGTAKAAPARSNTSGTSGRSGGYGGSAPVIVNVNSPEPAVVETPSSNSEALATSRLEKLYRGQFDKQASRDLKQFGYDFFNGHQARPEMAGPVPSHYILGPGDEVVLSLSGAVEAYHALTINRDGAINIPEFGNVSLAGETFAGLHDRIMGFLKERRHGFDLSVSLGRLRTIQVSVVGRVQNPGRVEISALGTPLTALISAGGPAKDGSLRRIELKRGDDQDPTSTSIDLYAYLSGAGDNGNMPVLRDGDTIVVPAVSRTIGIAGYVQRPAIYEILSESISVGEAVALAGGLTPFSFTPLAHLERTVDGRGRQRIDVELAGDGLKQPMGDGELLMIEAVDDARQPVVRIDGEVARPGDYAHVVGMRLSDLVARADGLTVDAYLPQVFISRQLGAPAGMESITGRSGHQQSRRVIVAELGKAMTGDPDHDVLLMPLDLVTVRSQFKAQTRAKVEIIGSVQNPGVYEMTAGMRVSDLVAIAGNPTPDVYYDQAELIRRVLDEGNRQLDVRRYRFDLRAALDPSNAKLDEANPLLANGDRLVVRVLQQAQVRVRIDGRVRFPGEYIFPAGARLTDLIGAAGGLLPDADLRAARFTRHSTRELQQQRIDHLIERTRRLSEDAFQNIVQTGRSNEGLAGRMALEQGQSTLNRIRKVEADGRIVIPFGSPDFPDTAYNLALESGDSLEIPRYHSTVSVAGHVFRPVTLVAGEPITLEDALEQAGGLTEFADEDLLYVIRADGSVDSVAQKPARLTRKTQLIAGDVLLVPSKPIERTFGAQLADALMLARQIAEVALVGSQIGKDLDMTLVSPFEPDVRASDPSILKD